MGERGVSEPSSGEQETATGELRAGDSEWEWVGAS